MNHSANVTITVLESADDEAAEAFARLIPLLSTGAPAPDRARVEKVLAHAANTVFAARALTHERDRYTGTIIGLATLVRLELGTGTEARLEDVVVDESARGTGVGRALTRAALRAAATRGARYVDLTSAPHRAAARALYRSLGFEERETGVFRHRLEDYR
jgi:ribosomal protein S18 acetylase RimI-like enzyme